MAAAWSCRGPVRARALCWAQRAIDGNRTTALPLLNPSARTVPHDHLPISSCFRADPCPSQRLSGTRRHYVLLYTPQSPRGCEKELVTRYYSCSHGRETRSNPLPIAPPARGHLKLTFLQHHFSFFSLLVVTCRVWSRRKLSSYTVSCVSV